MSALHIPWEMPPARRGRLHKFIEVVKGFVQSHRRHQDRSMFCDLDLHSHCRIKGCECSCHPS